MPERRHSPRLVPGLLQAEPEAVIGQRHVRHEVHVAVVGDDRAIALAGRAARGGELIPAELVLRIGGDDGLELRDRAREVLHVHERLAFLEGGVRRRRRARNRSGQEDQRDGHRDGVFHSAMLTEKGHFLTACSGCSLM
jgi:hypothetical protein